MSVIKHDVRRPVAVLVLCAVLIAAGRGTALTAGAGEPGGAPVASLTSWQNVLLGRWVAIDTFVGRYSRRHHVPARWTMMTFASESVMNPLAQGELPGDRGLGQVGFAAESKARSAGEDSGSRYYEPELDAHGSIWDPQTNTILAAISYQRIYHLVPQVKTPEQAYAVYTYGPDGILDDGTIRWDAQQRVDRALSFRPLFARFRQLKTLARTLSPAELRVRVPDPTTRAILAIDRSNRDGKATYDALERLYLRRVSTTRFPWVVVIFGKAALDFLDTGNRSYRTDESASYARLVTVLERQRARFAGEDEDLVALYDQLLGDARERAGAG